MKNKKFTQISLFLIGVLFLLFGCQKSDDTVYLAETVKDIDGNIYETVTIGSQVWMAENLRTTKYRNGDPIPNVTEKTQWTGLTTGAYCDYNNSTSRSGFGKLYNWHAVSDSRNIAPDGFRVATNEDWEILIAHLGGNDVAGGKLKETGTVNWDAPNLGASNSTGFTALPNGGRGDSGNFFGIGVISNWWNNTSLSHGDANTTYIEPNSESIDISYADRSLGFGVRCIKN